MRKKIALGFSIFFAVIGLAAFVPTLAPPNDHGQMLLGIFQVNSAQNIIHLLTAGAAFLAYAGGTYYAATYFKVFGLVYLAVALWGLPGLMGNYDGVLFNLIHVNPSTELLHIAIAAVALYAGFGLKDNEKDHKATA
jgi:hypothetical protein